MTLTDLTTRVSDVLGGTVSRADIEGTLRLFEQQGVIEGGWEDQDPARLADEVSGFVAWHDARDREDLAYMVEHQTDQSGSVG